MVCIWAGGWVGVPQGMCGGQRTPGRKECGSQGLNSIRQPWQQARLPAESSHLLTLVLTKQFSQLFGPLPCSSQMLLLEGRCVFHLPPEEHRVNTQRTIQRLKAPAPRSTLASIWLFGLICIQLLCQSCWEGNQH